MSLANDFTRSPLHSVGRPLGAWDSSQTRARATCCLSSINFLVLLSAGGAVVATVMPSLRSSCGPRLLFSPAAFDFHFGLHSADSRPPPPPTRLHSDLAPLRAPARRSTRATCCPARQVRCCCCLHLLLLLLCCLRSAAASSPACFTVRPDSSGSPRARYLSLLWPLDLSPLRT